MLGRVCGAEPLTDETLRYWFREENDPLVVAALPDERLAAKPEAQLRSRPSASGWAVGAALIVMALAAWTWGRRREIGLYRSLGLGIVGIYVMCAIEHALVIGLAAACALAWSVALQAAVGSLPPVDHIAFASRSVGSALALALIVGPLASLLHGRGSILSH